MKIDYPFKITTHNNLVLVDLPKTPNKYLEKGLLFTASNGIKVISSHIQACCHYENDNTIKFFIRGIDDNNKSGTLVVDHPKMGYTLTEMQAEEFKVKLQTALDEFVKWMEEQEKPVTRLDVFKELFPKAEFGEDGFPRFCPITYIERHTCKTAFCSRMSCNGCVEDFWNEPAPEKFQKSKKKEG